MGHSFHGTASARIPRLELVPVLRTGRLVLTPTSPADAGDYFAARSRIENDPARQRFLGSAPLLDRDAAAARLALLPSQWSSDPAALAFTLRTLDGSFVGLSGFVRWSRRDHRSEMFWEVDPQLEGKGFVTEAAKAIAQFGFEMLALHRIEAWMNVDHVRSRRVAERIGMRQEATLRDYWRNHDGEICTAALYVMFARERDLPT
jgi:[ribosomal protein S5]-alanine N-acetyltransferase